MGNGSIKDSTSANIPSSSRASSELSPNEGIPTGIDTTKDQGIKVINNAPSYLANIRRDIIGDEVELQKRTIVESADNSQTLVGTMEDKISHRHFPSIVLNYLHGNTDSKMSEYVLNEIAEYEKRNDMISKDFLPKIANRIIYDINKAPKDLIVEEYIHNILEITKISPTISSVLKKIRVIAKIS